MPVNPSPQRQSVITFPTPNVNDVLFFETVDAERIGTDVPKYGTKHPDRKKWPDHRLVHIEAADDQTRFYRFYYAADQLEQDDDNWSFSQADIGGTRFDAVTRQYVIRRSEFDPDSPAMGSVMPDVPEGKFGETPYVLAERKQIQLNDKTLTNLYVVEERTYVKKIPLVRYTFDELSKRNLKRTTTLYYFNEVVSGTTTADQLFADPTNTYWNIQIVNADGDTAGAGDIGDVCYGVTREGEQLSDNWYAITEQQVIGGSYTSGSLSLKSTYSTSVNYSWPPVLSTIEIIPWEKLSGEIERAPRYEFDPDGYSGPCRARVSLDWYVTAPTAVTTQQMVPKPISYTSPYFNINIPACLHNSVTAVCDIGNADPVFVQTVNTARTYSATNYTSWPSSIIADDDVQPSRGGYIRRTTTVFSPNSVTAVASYTPIQVTGRMATGSQNVTLNSVYALTDDETTTVGYIRSEYGVTFPITVGADGVSVELLSTGISITGGTFVLRDSLGNEVSSLVDETGSITILQTSSLVTTVALTFTTVTT